MKKLTKPNTPKMQGKGPVRYRQIEGPGSPLAISVDFRLASQPGSYTYADCFSLGNDKEIGIATLLFGQTDQNRKAGECIRIFMPSIALFTQFIPSTTPLQKTLTEQLKALKLETAKRPVGSESVLTATRFANVLFLATSVTEAVLDFYYMSGRDVHFARLNQDEIRLEPIIRIIMPLPVLQYLFDLCRPFAQSPATLSQESKNRANAI